jgi:hypothetical protein
MTGRKGGDSEPSAQDRAAMLNMLSEVHKALVASDLPEAAKHVAAATRTIECKR